MKKLNTYIIKSDRNYYALFGVTLNEAKKSARENSYINGFTEVLKMYNGFTVTMYACENGKISHRYDRA